MSNDLVDMLSTATLETLYMVVLVTLIGLLIGFPLGVILAVSDKGNIVSLPKTNKFLGTIINVIRSLPEIILIIILLPLARLVIGTTLGTNAAIVPLSIGSAPFLARIIENSLKEVAHGKIEAAQAVGASPFQIIVKVLIPEALPSLVRGITIGIISIVGFTAIAGAIGAGGLGSTAIRFGYQRFQTDVLIATVIVLVIIVQLIQFIGDHIAKLINKKRYKFE
ncbi:ABC transporter permease [Clostridium estertheticum]|uniref:ABC transporter permease n=1 Tax=Clostridium estertheticum TaxID=238834 RepID=A0AA47I8M1_9CLOT|nr:methionine ABC transporter permease [Clostridium estertheticum]MBU3154546.1 ABC transporter permease [Clostridium estertheticum]MBU3201240.1 ABC transporter permease [Clostridium estertheticum]WAG62020.1 ABC transporter permease [Clostridium estertheticum]WAG63856.1 ABC transporter permease [Clostridium estertheticum]